MIVPWGALKGFSVAALVREIASHYEVAPRTLRKGPDPRHGEHVHAARDALYYALTRERRLSIKRVAHILRIAPSTVRMGAQRHAERIAEFRAGYTDGRPE